MCRLIVIINEEINHLEFIEKFLLQSITEKNTPGINNYRDFNYHRDGYGIITKNSQKYSIYKSSLMYKNDNNFEFLKNKIINSKFTVGHLRATKTNFEDNICYNNTHPFWFSNNFFCHNGSITPFDISYFKKFIDNNYLSEIKGNTDSEVLFYILLTFKKSYDSKNAWEKFFDFLKNCQKENIIISANIIYINQNELFISRFINNFENPPSLYFDKNLMIISSEPVTDNFDIIDENNYFYYNFNSKKNITSTSSF